MSASFGDQILRGAILALIVSLLLIAIYIAFRFEWRFAVPMMRAMVHDVPDHARGLLAARPGGDAGDGGRFPDRLGYSIYDTIIIFDRVRENIPLMKRSSIRTIANVSLWETIPRSLATTFITLLPITALYLFGGETLKDFAFAMLIGISLSAYSIDLHRGAVPGRPQGEASRSSPAGATRQAPREESVGGLREAEELAAAAPAPGPDPGLPPG